MLNPEVEMLIESDTTAYVLWRALGEAVATHPLPPLPVGEDTAVAFLSVQDTGDVLLRTGSRYLEPAERSASSRIKGVHRAPAPTCRVRRVHGGDGSRLAAGDGSTGWGVDKCAAIAVARTTTPAAGTVRARHVRGQPRRR
ncbi:hypothetical protein [Streptomyces uncialis]|uniref:hypothetical protein n=1 Tax=Streptomyces uncialis TaxID=1048205 RepID=UPI00224DF4D3|nr:hypothetical protein [Streptomyces uncialis]MCX4661642.1 hypothetical protein [Streptomyces uncialis]